MDEDGNSYSQQEMKLRCSTLRPRLFFLTGRNCLQTHANASINGGGGLIFVPAMKSGRSRYTDAQGSYAPLLNFYDVTIPARSFRKAEDIPKIRNCRMQLFAAGVK